MRQKTDVKRCEEKNTADPVCGGRGRWCAGMLVLILSLLLLCGFDHEGQRVFDEGDLLSESQEDQLQAEVEELAEQISIDVVVVTTNANPDKTTQAYADDFYDEYGFGHGGRSGPGILFLIDMDNREYYISTAGEAISLYTDGEIEEMLDDIYPYMAEGDYYGACGEFLMLTREYGTNREVALNGYYDPAQDAFVEYTQEEMEQARRQAALDRIFSAGGILSRLGIAMIIGAVGVLIMMARVSTHKVPHGRVYLKAGSELIRDREDRKINTTVTRQRIQRNTGARSGGGGGGGFSSGHTSGGGRSHGGGGRGF